MPPKQFLLIPLALCAVECAAWAQASQVSGPGEGFVFDQPTKSIRPVIGTLGSAFLGQPVFAGVDAAFVAPRRDYAIAFQGGRPILVSSLASSPRTLTLLGDNPPAFEGVAWSDDGSTAVLFSRAGSWMQTISGIPGSIAQGDLVTLTSLGSLSSIAVDPRGVRLIAGLTGDNPGLYDVSGGQSPSRLLSVAQPASIAFSSDGRTLYAIDSTVNQGLVFDLASFTAQSLPLPEVDDAIAALPARDASGRQVIYVAGRASQLLAVYDAITFENLAVVALPVSPSTLEPFGNAGFVVSRRSTETDPLWTFRNSTPPIVLFVPALPAQPGEDSSR